MSTSPKGAHWEKRGNTAWVSCAACAGWFPVGPQLIAAGTIDLVCPHCAAAFPPAKAKQILEP